jgi:hypothetical protein
MVFVSPEGFCTFLRVIVRLRLSVQGWMGKSQPKSGARDTQSTRGCVLLKQADQLMVRHIALRMHSARRWVVNMSAIIPGASPVPQDMLIVGNSIATGSTLLLPKPTIAEDLLKALDPPVSAGTVLCEGLMNEALPRAVSYLEHARQALLLCQLEQFYGDLQDASTTLENLLLALTQLGEEGMGAAASSLTNPDTPAVPVHARIRAVTNTAA